MTVHHTIRKSATTLGLEIVEENGEFTFTKDGQAWGRGTNAKEALAEAKENLESGDPLESEEPEAEDEQEDTGAGSVVKGKYRQRYKEIGQNDSNGDPLALALRAALTVTGEKASDVRMAETKLAEICEANGIKVPNGRNPGHTRMIAGNMLRGLWKNGKDIDVLGTVVPATAEAKAKQAERFAAEKAKAERKAAPRKSEAEKKAARNEKAKARRAAKKPAPAEQPAA